MKSIEAAPSAPDKQPEPIDIELSQPDVDSGELIDTEPPQDNSEVVSAGRESLSRSRSLQQWVREQAFNKVSGADMAKSEIENGVANIKRPYLERKQKALERNAAKYEHKAATSMFAFRRENFAQKARWAKRRLQDTKIKLANHNTLHGKKNPETGKKEWGKAHEAAKKRYVERVRQLEKQRAKLLENQLVAQERKRRREMNHATKQEGLTFEQRARMVHMIDQLDHISKFRESVREMLQTDLKKRMDKFEKTVKDSDHRWRWNLQEDQAENHEAGNALGELDRAVNSSTNPEHAAVEDALSDLESASDELMDDDREVVK